MSNHGWMTKLGAPTSRRYVTALKEVRRNLPVIEFEEVKFMLLHPSHKTSDFIVSIYGEKIERVDQFRYLGIDLDPKLCYGNHVARITMKCKQALGALCRTVRKWTPKHVFTKLYQSTIEPILTYAMEAWYPSQVVLQKESRVSNNSLHTVVKVCNNLDAETVRIQSPMQFKHSIREAADYESIYEKNMLKESGKGNIS
uniref:Uncharacterized protein n=1 Tax=Acrobeloides nanus TaxID=290746 RepID=A0A914DPF7_9BILA